jgi:hypothetical protein
VVDDVFERLLAPIAPEAFFREHFEREPLHVVRNDPAYFADLYGVADVEDALHVGAAQRDKFTLVKEGEALDVEIDARVALAQFDLGYTLVISDATLFSPRLQQICNRIGARLGGFAVANVYFTPARARGFDVHSDNHGTIVLQIEGRKRWRLYEPLVELPVAERRFAPDEAKTLTSIGDVELAQGDTLYLPQGVPHEASAGERSLHVTLALRPPRVGDLVQAMVRLAIEDDVELRRAWLPAGVVPQDLFRRLWRPERLGRAKDLLSSERMKYVRPLVDAAFDALTAVDELFPSARLRKRDDVPSVTRPRGGELELLVGNRTYLLPAACGPLLERLDAGLRFSDVQAALADEDALSFVRLLVVTGLASILPPNEA